MLTRQAIEVIIRGLHALPTKSKYLLAAQQITSWFGASQQRTEDSLGKL
jgi:hypothetical protein